MKIKKTIAALLACACILPMGALMACGGNAGNGGNNTGNGGDEVIEQNPPGVTTYTFEAEGVDLSEQSGRGWSNEASGCQMIQGQNVAKIKENSTVMKSISNGYFVGFFSTEGTELVFEINAEAAEENATLVLRLASEWGTMTVDSSVMTVEVNDANVAYTAFELTGKKIDSATEIEYGVPFKDITIGQINLKKGTNTIKVIAQGKPYPASSALSMGPGVDCIKIKAKTKLTWVEDLWEENKDNVKEY